MSFTQHSIQRLSSTSSGKSDPGISYSATWRLHGWSDDNTAPTFSDVYSYLRSNSSLPYHGRAFSYEGFRDSTAICVGIDPEVVTGGKSQWDVRAVYESIKAQKQEQPDSGNGDLTEDPLRWRRECVTSWSQTSIAVEEAIFRGFSRPVGNRHLVPGRRGSIVNSALAPLDVQHLAELDQQTVAISKYVGFWDNAIPKEWIGAVNKAAFNFRLADLNGRFSFDQYTLKIRNWGAVSEYINGKPFWKQTVEFLYNPKGWRLFVLDSGFGPRQFPNDPKQGADSNELVTQEEYTKYGGQGVFVDASGNPSALPRLLNGNGGELNVGFPPVFLEYQIYEREADFGNIERFL